MQQLVLLQRPAEEYVEVAIRVSGNETLEALTSLRDFVASEVRAKELTISRMEGGFEAAEEAYVKDWEIDGETVRIAVSRLGRN